MTSARVSAQLFALSIVLASADGSAQDVPDAGVSAAGDAAAGSPTTAAEEAAPEESELVLTAGIDLVTRFIWRGVSFGDQWTIQPTATIGSHGFSTTFWASAAPNQSSLVDYVGITLSYAHVGDFGTLGVDLADWIFSQRVTTDAAGDPVVAIGAPYLFDVDGHGNGSHWLDATASYIGPEAFPIKVQFGLVVYNDPDFSKYVGLSYPIDLGRGFLLTPEFGVVFGRSRRWYFTDDDPVNVTNCALTLRRDVALGRGIVMPISLAAIVNPESERMHVVGSIGIHL